MRSLLRSDYWKPALFRGFLKTYWIFRLVVHLSGYSTKVTDEIHDFGSDILNRRNSC